LGHYLIFQVFPNSCCQKEINTVLRFLQAENNSLTGKYEKKPLFFRFAVDEIGFWCDIIRLQVKNKPFTKNFNIEEKEK